MPNMEYIEPTFQHHYQNHHEQMSSHFSDAHQSFAMQQTANMISIPTTTKTTETKPRLGKDEVDILEREFKKNPKPTTQTKRQFAEEMGVDLARINNWFQNRRAKRKQEKKQEAFEAGQSKPEHEYSEPSSPDMFNGTSYFSNSNVLPIQQPPSTVSFLFNNGPSTAVAPYNPQYADPSSASLESLQRTLAVVHAASDQDEFQTFGDHESLASFGAPMMHESLDCDRAQFSSSEESLGHFNGNQAYPYASEFANNLYDNSSQSVTEIHLSPEEPTNKTPTPFNTSRPEMTVPLRLTTFPSQLLSYQSHDSVTSADSMTSESESPETTSASSSMAIGFSYDDIPESEESPASPPAPSIPFKSPPPPMDIASRRKKVQVKPAALVADTLRSRPPMGPRTVSHADGFRRSADSPISSPMRRIASAGGNRNVLTGRICKSGVESAQRSPINLGGFADAGAFLEHNYHTIRNPPSLTAGSSLNSSLAPPTPMSPRERERVLTETEYSRSTASPVNGGVNFVFNAGTGGFTTMEGDQNLASPPETPQAHMALHPSHTWPTTIEFPEKQWTFEVPDEALYTPAHDSFPLELHMPQPSYLSMSQPVTPAFGQFNPSLMFGGHESPQYKTESPQYTHSTQAQTEYAFPDPQQFPQGMSPTMTKQKTFQFSHTTAADFSEK